MTKLSERVCQKDDDDNNNNVDDDDGDKGIILVYTEKI